MNQDLGNRSKDVVKIENKNHYGEEAEQGESEFEYNKNIDSNWRRWIRFNRGDTALEAVNHLLIILQQNLCRVQERMKEQADKHGREVKFKPKESTRC